ncbi:MAG: PadR family transcriptional regulator [Alphaproteobacteria bacterium]|nr:PadR family transcriptional regulator [Alphaproteobacteria bacterium]
MNMQFHARRHGRGVQAGPCQVEQDVINQEPEALVCEQRVRGRRGQSRRGGEGHHGGRGSGEGRGTGGGRRGRLLSHGDLRLITIALLGDKPRHGYEIIKSIEEKLGGAYAPSPGVIYPTLTMLEELGHVTVTAHDGKKMHTLTPEGQAYLDANRASVEVLEAKMATIRATFGQTPSPEIIRAMENMRLALHLRLAAGPMTAESTRTIAEALDKVALLIERHST